MSWAQKDSAEIAAARRQVSIFGGADGRGFIDAMRILAVQRTVLRDSGSDGNSPLGGMRLSEWAELYVADRLVDTPASRRLPSPAARLEGQGRQAGQEARLEVERRLRLAGVRAGDIESAADGIMAALADRVSREREGGRHGGQRSGESRRHRVRQLRLEFSNEPARPERSSEEGPTEADLAAIAAGEGRRPTRDWSIEDLLRASELGDEGWER